MLAMSWILIFRKPFSASEVIIFFQTLKSTWLVYCVIDKFDAGRYL